MRIKVTETKVYTWNELTDEQKEKVLEKQRYINVDYEWWDGIYEDAAEVGIKITSFNLDRNRHAEGEFTLSAAEVAANIIRDHGEQCETYKTAEKFLGDQNDDPMPDEDDDDFPEWENRMIDLEEEFRKSIIEDYSIMLQKESEYLLSDDAIIETIEANEYEFDENGNIA